MHTQMPHKERDNQGGVSAPLKKLVKKFSICYQYASLGE
jgi:hypothetical protein